LSGLVAPIISPWASTSASLTSLNCLARFQSGNAPRIQFKDGGARLMRFERDLVKVLIGAGRCRLRHFTIEDAIDPA
jgi:hypothetical protein